MPLPAWSHRSRRPRLAGCGRRLRLLLLQLLRSGVGFSVKFSANSNTRRFMPAGP